MPETDENGSRRENGSKGRKETRAEGMGYCPTWFLRPSRAYASTMHYGHRWAYKKVQYRNEE